MPELPEVETICRSLAPLLTGRIVEKIQVRDRRLRQPINATALQKQVKGHTIVGLSRRGKYLIWHMDHNARLLIHLGMSGRLGYYSDQTPVEPHTHVRFFLNGGHEIRYRDPRRFGCVLVIPPLAKGPLVLDDLGPEPFSAEFTAEYLWEQLHHSKRAVKTALMDSRMVVGVGNIYANEVLFFCAIAPQRPAAELTLSEWRRVRDAVVEVLQRAIERGGTTLKDFRNGMGEPGFFQMELAVYDQEAQPCRRCGGLIQRTVLQGRSTYFCTHCQK